MLLVVKYIHILAAIVAVGLNISYAVWIIRARRDRRAGLSLRTLRSPRLNVNMLR